MPKLSTLLSYDVRVQQYLDDVCDGLSSDFARLTDLPSDVADRVIAYLLELSCQAQNTRNIALGREFLLSANREWLLLRIEQVAAATLNLNDEWQYRRLLELYALLGDDLASRLIAFGQISPNDEVVEAASGSMNRS